MKKSPQGRTDQTSEGGFLTRHSVLTALGGYLLLAALFYAPLLLGLRTFADGDFTRHFLPFSLFQQASIRAGELPLWNPYTYSGHPFLADIQAAVYYPLSNALLLLTLPFDAPEARLYWLQVEAIVQVALAGFFVYTLLRDLTRKSWAAFLAGVLFAFSGYLTGYPPVQLAVLRSAIWLPLILWLLWRGFARPQEFRWWIGAALAYAVAFTAGHPQTFLYISYTVAAWSLTLLVVGWRRERQKPGFFEKPGFSVLGLLIFALLTLGLIAAQLLPSLEFTRLSVRADVSYAYVSGGFPLRDTWQLILPGVFTVYSPLYVGMVGLGAVAAAIAGLFARTAQTGDSAIDSAGGGAQPLSARGATGFFLVLGLMALLLSYGDNGFLYPIFHRLAPGWNFFRGQERAAYLVILSLSALAGLGAAAIPTLAPRTRRRTAIIYGGLATVGVYAFGMLHQLSGNTAIGSWRYLLVAALSLILAMSVALMLWLPGWSRQRTRLLIALAFVNLLLANGGTNFAPYGPARAVMLAPELEALGAAVADRDDANLGLPGRVYNEFRVYEDYGMRQQIEDVWGASPLRLARYAALFDDFPLDRMWRLTGVEHVLTWRKELFEPSQLLAEFPQSTDTTYLHRLGEPNPRAWLVDEVLNVDDAAALGLLADHQFDVERVGLLPLVTKDQRPTTNDEGPATVAAQIEMERLANNRLKVQSESDVGGLLIISENWMPGWRVEAALCDGEPGCDVAMDGPALLQPLRADLAFIGVWTPPGAVSFELVYDPDSARYGRLISLIALALIVYYAGWRWLVRRRG